jgi:hypothetical protein
MASFLNLRDFAGFALRPQEESVHGHVMPPTAMSVCAAAGGEMVEGMRPLSRPHAGFRAAENAGIGAIRIGSTAIRNRCQSPKTKGGGHF